MTKADLVKKIASETGVLRKDTAIVVDAFLDSIKECLIKGERIEIRGFGTFSLKERKPRIGRNPKSGKIVPVPARVAPAFKYTRGIKDEVEKLSVKDIKK